MSAASSTPPSLEPPPLLLELCLAWPSPPPCERCRARPLPPRLERYVSRRPFDASDESAAAISSARRQIGDEKGKKGRYYSGNWR